MILNCNETHFKEILAIINDAASAYKGIIPEDLWHEPYMSEDELKSQIKQGIRFWCYTENEEIMGVMGLQDKEEVMLVRHAYVRTAYRNKGIGGKLLKHLLATIDKPVLIGTWADAEWAIGFYQKHGFRLLQKEENAELHKKYWSISPRQVETSVVLASPDWKSGGLEII